jgi:hypothetical protein
VRTLILEVLFEKLLKPLNASLEIKVGANADVRD